MLGDFEADELGVELLDEVAGDCDRSMTSVVVLSESER